MSPTNEWINGVQLIPEGRLYKVDGAGRVIIPANLRAKFKIDFSDDMDYYTTFADGKWFLCMTKHYPIEEENEEKEK